MTSILTLEEYFSQILDLDKAFQAILSDKGSTSYSLIDQHTFIERYTRSNIKISEQILQAYWGAISLAAPTHTMTSMTRQTIWQRSYEELRIYHETPSLCVPCHLQYLPWPNVNINTRVETSSVETKNNLLTTLTAKQTIDFITHLMMLSHSHKDLFTHLHRQSLASKKEQKKRKKILQKHYHPHEFKKLSNSQLTYLSLYSATTLVLQSHLSSKSHTVANQFYILHICISMNAKTYTIPLELALMLRLWGVHYTLQEQMLFNDTLYHHLITDHFAHTAHQLACIQAHLQSPLAFHQEYFKTAQIKTELTHAWRFESLIQLLLMTPVSVWSQCSAAHKKYWENQSNTLYYVRLTALSQDLISGADLSVQRIQPHATRAWLQLSMSCDLIYIENKEKQSKLAGCCGCLSPVSLARLAETKHLFWKNSSHTPTTLQGKTYAIRNTLNDIISHAHTHVLGPIGLVSVGLMSLIFDDLSQHLKYIPSRKLQKIKATPLHTAPTSSIT